jgi:hypothetical protein
MRQSLAKDVDQAIPLAFCACVIDDEDEVEKGLSGTHAAMIVELTRRVELLLAEPAHRGDRGP